MPSQTPSPEKFVERLLEFMPRLSLDMARADRRVFTDGTLTLSQLWALEYLLTCSACTMRELAQRLSLTASTTTGLVDQLARRGLVLRRRGETDRRVVNVALTAPGRRAMEQIRRHKRRTLRRWFSRFPATERATFLNSMEKLQLGFGRPAGPAQPKEAT